MTLSKYHANYASRTDEELQQRADAKEMEIKKIFAEVGFTPKHSPVRIAVTGCADKRFVELHRQLFERILGIPAALTTFDITIDHLVGAEGVVQHDITEPFPGGPFDLTFGHVVLKFIETEKQWEALKCAYESLAPGGMAIEVLDREDVTTTMPKQRDDHYSVPLERWKQALEKEKIKFKIVEWNLDVKGLIRGVDGLALILVK